MPGVPPNRPDLPMLAGVALPPGWMWGCGQSAYQTEGGINNATGPHNNWFEWEATGRVEPSGDACDFWQRPELTVDRAQEIGLNCLRISIEWARVEPRRGEVDETSLDRYADILALCHSGGIDPHICLWHFTHPQWLGPDPWVSDPDRTVARFAAHVARVVDHLATAMVRRGLPPPHYWLTLNEPNVAPLGTYVFAGMPPGRIGGIRAAMSMYDALGCAHVAAYEAIHATYEHRGLPTPMVSANTSAIGVYELDFMFLDVLVGARDFHARAWLFRRALREAPRHAYPIGLGVERTIQGLLARARDRGRVLPRTRAAVATSRRGRAIDWIAADWYTPFLTEYLRVPGRPNGAGGVRQWWPGLELWEQRPNPAGVRWYLNQCAQYGLPVALVESGMCSPGRAPRRDGWDRSTFLRAMVAATLGALSDGVELIGYLHWSLTDNYEWGSYVPRFGLHACDRDGAGVHVADTDALGGRPAATYRDIIHVWPAEGGRADATALARVFAAE